MSQIHDVCVNAVPLCRAEAGPVYPQGPALEEIGKEKGSRPGEDDGDHGPDRRLDERSLEYSENNLSASVDIGGNKETTFYKKAGQTIS